MRPIFKEKVAEKWSLWVPRALFTGEKSTTAAGKKKKKKKRASAKHKRQ